MAEIICVSCWKSFEVEEPAPVSVDCPHCEFSQPGQVGDPHLAMAETPEAVIPPPAETPEAVMPSPPPAETPEAVMPSPPPAETPEAVMPSLPPAETPEALAAPTEEPDPFESMEEALAAADPEEESDERWRVQTSTGLLLFFPTHLLACQWADAQDDPEMAIGTGRSPLRPYTAFAEAMKSTDDPAQALAGVAPAGDQDMGAGETEETEGPVAPPPPIGAAVPLPPPPAALEVDAQPVATDTGGEEALGGPDATPARTTSEFTFRTQDEPSVWKGRLLFLTMGLLLGAGGMYYFAWLGVLPGVLY